MPIGIAGVVRIEIIEEGKSIQCSCGTGKIRTIDQRCDGDYRATCVCGRIVSISKSGAYTPAYPAVSEVVTAT